jgi:hypothetical protein
MKKAVSKCRDVRFQICSRVSPDLVARHCGDDRTEGFWFFFGKADGHQHRLVGRLSDQFRYFPRHDNVKVVTFSEEHLDGECACSRNTPVTLSGKEANSRHCSDAKHGDHTWSYQ